MKPANHGRQRSQAQDERICAIFGKKAYTYRTISVEEFLRFVIEELRVQPIRNDWNDILKSNYQLHKKYRTWPK